MDEKLFEGDPITLRETPEKVTDVKAYHRKKTADYRGMWVSIGVVPLSMQIPEKHKAYMLAVAKLLTYEVAVKEVENRDPDLLDMFANKQIRFGASREEMFNKVKEYADHDADDKRKARLYADAKSILSLSDAMMEAHKGAVLCKETNDIDNHFYWLAKEYALSLYIRAARELFELREQNTDLPENLEI